MGTNPTKPFQYKWNLHISVIGTITFWNEVTMDLDSKGPCAVTDRWMFGL
jgi:hypothetical protein